MVARLRINKEICMCHIGFQHFVYPLMSEGEKLVNHPKCTYSTPHTNLNPLKPNDPYRGRTAPLTSKRCILYIYSTNIGTEYFKHGVYTLRFFPLQNAVCFVILTYFGSCIIHNLYAGCAKIKKK